MNVKAKALLKITAHSGESTTLAWHPIQPNVVATGGASDRCVKVWDLESYLSMEKNDSNMASNLNTMTSVMTETSAESNTSRYVFLSAESGFVSGDAEPISLSLSDTHFHSIQLFSSSRRIYIAIRIHTDRFPHVLQCHPSRL
jgi:WD40 repeat protein